MNTIFNEKQQEEIINDYVNNVNIDDIIKKYNTDERSIRTILKEKQIDRQYNTFSEELYKRIIELYDQRKYTQKRIRDDLLISDCGINKTLKRNGIRKRTYSENNRIFDRDQHYFDKIDTPNKAYTMGLIYADGNNFTKHNALTISLQESDKKVLERIKDELKYEGQLRRRNLSEKNKNYKNQVFLNINDEYISKRLEELGVVDAKSLILTFPEWLDKTLYSHFIRGYFDGDGSVSVLNSRFNPNNLICRINIAGTLEFCTSVRNILNSLNIKTYIYHPKQCGESNTYVLCATSNEGSYNFLTWIYNEADIKIERKYQKYLTYKEYREKRMQHIKS